jgi:hypothetical protein
MHQSSAQNSNSACQHRSGRVAHSLLKLVSPHNRLIQRKDACREILKSTDAVVRIHFWKNG